MAAATDSKGALAEQILKEIYALYCAPYTLKHVGSVGLEQIGADAGITPEVMHPRRRVTVMVIGNHSAGKSSFINWYIEEDVQPTSVAVETQGFTLIRSGTEAQEVRGKGALVDNEHIGAAATRMGGDSMRFVENLSLVVRTSRAKDFARIDLLDTPGLVDGEVTYPYDVNRAIVELANLADLVLVFLDPIGQALCTRTMDVVKQLNDRGHHDKMRYFLTKADTVARREDLTKVLVQVTTNLAQRVKNTHGFNVPCMWIPQRESGALSHPPANETNGLGPLCADVSKIVVLKVQSNMTQCADDCARLREHIDRELVAEAGRRAVKARWGRYTLLLAPAFVALAALAYLDVLVALEPVLPAGVASAPVTQALLAWAHPAVGVLEPLGTALGADTVARRLFAAAGAFLFLSVLVQFLRCRSRGLKTRSAAEVARLRNYADVVELMATRVAQLYREYVRAAQAPEFSSPAAAATGAGRQANK